MIGFFPLPPPSQITYLSSGATRYFSCQSTRERDEWVRSLRATLSMAGQQVGVRRERTGLPDHVFTTLPLALQERRRTDNCLKLSVLEVKGLRDKKRYYVEILVDDKLYAR